MGIWYQICKYVLSFLNRSDANIYIRNNFVKIFTLFIIGRSIIYKIKK